MAYSRSSSSIRWVVLLLACLSMFGSYYVYDNPAALKNSLSAYLNISNTQYNWLYSIYSFPNIILPFFGGYLVDRLGTNLMLFSFLCLICLGQFIFALGASLKSYPVCMLGRAVFGFGGESLSVAQSTLLSLWFRGKEMALAMGINLSVARLGSVVNDQVSPAVQSAGNVPDALWLGFFVCCFSLSATITLIFVERWAAKKATEEEQARLMDQPVDGKVEEKKPAEEINFSDVRYFPRSYWLLTCSCVIVYAAVLPFNNIAEGLLEDKYKLGQTVADRYLAVPFFISACCSPFLGGIVDRFGHRAHLLTVSACTLSLAHLLMAFTHIEPAVPLVIIGLSYSVYAAAVWPSVAFVIEEHQLGTAYGLITAVQNAGLATAPLLVGTIQDHTCEDQPGIDHCVCVTHCVVSTEIFFACIAAVGVVVGILLNIEDARMGGVLNKASHKTSSTETTDSNTPATSSDALNNDAYAVNKTSDYDYQTEHSQNKSTYRPVVE